MSQAQKLLFVCSPNRLRSMTAEHMYRGFMDYLLNFADTSPRAMARLNVGHIGLADINFVTEMRHGRPLAEKFADALAWKRIICLRIPEVYRYREPALMDELKAGLDQCVEVPA